MGQVLINGASFARLLVPRCADRLARLCVCSSVFVPCREMTEVMISSTPMEDIRLSPSKDRLTFQVPKVSILLHVITINKTHTQRTEQPSQPFISLREIVAYWFHTQVILRSSGQTFHRGLPFRTKGCRVPK